MIPLVFKNVKATASENATVKVNLRIGFEPVPKKMLHLFPFQSKNNDNNHAKKAPLHSRYVVERFGFSRELSAMTFLPENTFEVLTFSPRHSRQGLVPNTA